MCFFPIKYKKKLQHQPECDFLRHWRWNICQQFDMLYSRFSNSLAIVDNSDIRMILPILLGCSVFEAYFLNRSESTYNILQSTTSGYEVILSK